MDFLCYSNSFQKQFKGFTCYTDKYIFNKPEIIDTKKMAFNKKKITTETY